MPENLFDLTGKVALVTGGNGGIGLGMAEGLAEAGACVAIWGTSETKNEAAVTRLRDLSPDVAAFVCDVSDEEAVDAAFAQTLDRFGRVDACFANAGIGGGGGPFHEMSTEAWRRVLAVNLDGVFFTFRAASRHMIERGGGGSLVVTSSISAIDGSPRSQHYASSKGAVLAMVRGLAVELARHGITANAIVPGWIETGMTDRRLNSDLFAERVLPRVPMRRWGQATDFGGVAVYLASGASRYHTGDTLVIDGGYTKF